MSINLIEFFRSVKIKLQGKQEYSCFSVVRGTAEQRHQKLLKRWVAKSEKTNVLGWGAP